MPELEKIDHVHVYATDRLEAEKWYEEVLGFSRVRELERWFMDGGPLTCLLYTSPSPRDLSTSRMPSSA